MRLFKWFRIQYKYLRYRYKMYKRLKNEKEITPDKLTENQRSLMRHSLIDFLRRNQSSKYLMLTSISGLNYMTVFSKDTQEELPFKIETFIEEHLGTIQKFNYVYDHISFCIGNKEYVLFEFDSGIVSL